jgi:hypothetical protein
VNLPADRDQITTKETREFAHLRTEVSRLVRGDTARGDLARPAAPHESLRRAADLPDLSG